MIELAGDGKMAARRQAALAVLQRPEHHRLGGPPGRGRRAAAVGRGHLRPVERLRPLHADRHRPHRARRRRPVRSHRIAAGNCRRRRKRGDATMLALAAGVAIIPFVVALKSTAHRDEKERSTAEVVTAYTPEDLLTLRTTGLTNSSTVARGEEYGDEVVSNRKSFVPQTGGVSRTQPIGSFRGLPVQCSIASRDFLERVRCSTLRASRQPPWSPKSKTLPEPRSSWMMRAGQDKAGAKSPDFDATDDAFSSPVYLPAGRRLISLRLRTDEIGRFHRPCYNGGMKRRLAQLPLHSGKAPPWLFQRMTKLAGAITMAIVDEFGPEEMLQRLADPWWFQAFGCVLGFDWHSSGVTTVTCGAMKEAAKRFGPDLGILVAGGKGGVSRKTPQEIAAAASGTRSAGASG